MGVLAVYVCTLRRSLLSTILFRSFMSEVTDKQGCQCFSKKQTGYGQRVLQCPHALPSVPITIKIQPAVFLHSHWCLSLPPAFFFFYSPTISPHYAISLHPGPPSVLLLPAWWWHSLPPCGGTDHTCRSPEEKSILFSYFLALNNLCQCWHSPAWDLC